MNLAGFHDRVVFDAIKAGNLYACRYCRQTCQNYLPGKHSLNLYVIQTIDSHVADVIDSDQWQSLVIQYGVDKAESLSCGCIRESIKLGIRKVAR